MSRADESNTRFYETPEYLHIVYRWMRQPVRMPHAGARYIRQQPAHLALRHARRWVEAITR